MITRSQVTKMGTLKELKDLMEQMQVQLCSKIDKLTAKLDEKDAKILELQNKIVLLEEREAYNDKRFELLERCLDDNEQYGRRTSLRISGIPSNVNETSEQCLSKVKEEVLKLVPGLNDRDFDRAHRVGKPTSRDGTAQERQIIVKFTSFWARTSVYRNRAKEQGRPRFYIDQTKRRFQLRKKAVEYVKTKPTVDFIFVDINCNLSIRFKNGKYGFFNSEEELIKLCG